MPARTSSRRPDVPIPFNACDPSGTFVFVSYAHVDKALVYPELVRIRSLGIRVWYDEGIEPGSEWPESVANALYGATAFVVMISQAAVASRNVRNEINAAVKWDKPFFAIHLAPASLPKGLELQMGDVQAVMRWQLDEASYARKLAKALARYAQAEAPGRTSARASAAAPSQSPPVAGPSARTAMPSQLLQTLTSPSMRRITGMAFSPDGRLLATVSDHSNDTTVWLWDPATGRQVRTIKGDPAMAVAFSPDGRLLATGGSSRGPGARLWDPATGRLVREFEPHSWVDSLAFSSDGGQIVAVDRPDETASVWDAATGRRRSHFKVTAPGSKTTAALKLVTGRKPYLTATAFSPDGRLLATGHSDGNVQLWDPATGQCKRTIRHEHARKYVERIEVVAFGPGGNLLVSANVDDARLWDLKTSREARVLGSGKTEVRTYQVMAAAFSLDGRLLATGDYKGNVHLWNPATGKRRRSFKPESAPGTLRHVHVSSVAFSPDGRQLAVGKFWDMQGDSASVQVWG